MKVQPWWGELSLTSQHIVVVVVFLVLCSVGGGAQTVLQSLFSEGHVCILIPQLWAQGLGFWSLEAARSREEGNAEVAHSRTHTFPLAHTHTYCLWCL